jgi:hypothetical protein
MGLMTVHGARMKGIAVSYVLKFFVATGFIVKVFHILLQLYAQENFIELLEVSLLH